MIKKKKFLKIAIDSPAAAGAGTLGKARSKNYNLFYLDTGKIYRFVAYLKIKFPKKFNNKFIKLKIKSLKMKVTFKEVLKTIKLRDKRDFTRKIAPLKKTKDSLLINTTNLSKRSCFLKIKKIIDKKLIVNGNI